MAKPAVVRTSHPSYLAMSAKWKRCRDAAEGESAVHAATTQYLSKLSMESDADYKARLGRTPFFNATWRTISGLRGMLFRKPPIISAPAAIEKYFADIDMAGTGLDQFAAEIAEESLTVGRVGILVDYPAAPSGGATVAQVEGMGLRPYLQIYKAETIINWREARINNVQRLVLAVLAESASISDDEFSHKTEPRYRVLDIFEGAYRQRVYKVDERGEDELLSEVFPMIGGAQLDYIPFLILGADCIGSEVYDPPLIDLVDMNIHHYAVSADYEHGCHFSGLPSLFISGYIPDINALPIYIGGAGANCLPDPQARAYFVETTSNFAALRVNLEDKKSQMAVLGARMLETQRDGVEAAETAAQHRKGEESLLAGIANNLSSGLEAALMWLAEWLRAAGEISVQINRDFMPMRMSAQEMSALVGAWQSGAISHQTLFENLQRGEIIADSIDFAQEQSRTSDAAPKFAQGSASGY